MVLSAGVANPSVSPLPSTRENPRHSPQTSLTRAKPTWRMVKNCGPQWLGLFMAATPSLAFAQKKLRLDG